MAERTDDYEYQVALSFAGEDRAYVGRVASCLQDAGVRVFYDDYEKVTLWGKDLSEHLDWVYQEAAKYCVLFASKEYASKVGRTTSERVLRRGRLARSKNTSSPSGSIPQRYLASERPLPTST